VYRVPYLTDLIRLIRLIYLIYLAYLDTVGGNLGIPRPPKEGPPSRA
jgi:hypothetical protein